METGAPRMLQTRLCTCTNIAQTPILYLLALKNMEHQKFLVLDTLSVYLQEHQEAGVADVSSTLKGD